MKRCQNAMQETIMVRNEIYTTTTKMKESEVQQEDKRGDESMRVLSE